MNYKLFEYIKASNFFPKYAKGVSNWKHKLRGIDGNKNPIAFSEEDEALIKKGLQKMTQDLLKRKL